VDAARLVVRLKSSGGGYLVDAARLVVTLIKVLKFEEEMTYFIADKNFKITITNIY
jgi:hypothetical protein